MRDGAGLRAIARHADDSALGGTFAGNGVS
jgi:hypothetical protein